MKNNIIKLPAATKTYFKDDIGIVSVGRNIVLFDLKICIHGDHIHKFFRKIIRKLPAATKNHFKDYIGTVSVFEKIRILPKYHPVSPENWYPRRSYHENFRKSVRSCY